MGSIITVEHFVKKYGGFTAVDNVSFEVEEGSIFAFLGPNGAGKSSTIHTLCTMTERTSGTLRIDGKDVHREKDEVRSVIGVVFQDTTLDNKMTVEENLRMHGHFYNVPKSRMKKRIDRVLEIVDMAEWKNAMAGSLSGGMKRRVEMARSLMHAPKVLFLDEPTTGLDPQTRANIWAYIVKLQKETNLTVFLTTHYMDEAEISHKVAIMDHGKIVAYDAPQALKKRYTNDQALITSIDEQRLEELLHKHQLNFTKSTGRHAVAFGELSDLMEVITEHRPFIQDLEIRKGTLNDVFLAITGKDMRG